MSMVQINFIFVAHFAVVVSRVDPTSKQESQVGAYGSGVITQSALPGTEWRFAEMGQPGPFQTYVTTDAPTQHVVIGQIVASPSPPAPAPVTAAHVTPAPVTAAHVTPAAAPVTAAPVTQGVVITGPLMPAVPVTQSPVPVTVTVTPGVAITGTPTPVPVTVTVTPGVAITGTPSNPSISLGPTTPPPGGIPLAGARGSIFNSDSFDMNVINLERAIRQQTGLTDVDQLRAVIWARLVEIAMAPNRTRDEQAVVDWLVKQVKNARVEAARLALEEYDKWNGDPWSYVPPQGYGFPDYVIQSRNSLTWLTTTPNPPVLADDSWQNLFAGIVSSNGWSPLNNPLLTKGGKKNASLENAVGFSVFGTVLAYHKLYGTPNGNSALAQTLALLVDQSFKLSPVGPMNTPFNVSAARQMFLAEIAPYSYRDANIFWQQIKAGAGETVKFPPQVISEKGAEIVKNMTDAQLRQSLAKLTTGDVFWSFVTTLMISLAIQALIAETFMLVNKIKLRGDLVAKLEEQRSAPLPDPKNLFYCDINHLLFGDDYQPTDPVELERLMASREAHRAFLLATL